jgi:uncharacterized membrane protein
MEMNGMYTIGIRRRLALALCLCAGLLGTAGCDDPARPEPVAAVDVTAPATRLAVGQSMQLAVAVQDAAGQVLEGRAVAWSSSDEAVAAVDADGRVTGRAPGSATITATSGGKQDRVELVVAPALTLTLAPDTFLLVVGRTTRISGVTAELLARGGGILAELRDEQGQYTSRALAFSSSDPAVASVSESGEVRALAPGAATIRVRADDATAELHLVVERPYTLTYLGALPGAAGSGARDVNEAGQVVGISGAHPFIWENGAMRRLTFPGLADSVYWVDGSLALNDRGEVAGVLYTRSGRHIFVRGAGGTLAVPYVGNGPGYVADINNRGDVVGGWSEEMCSRNCDGGGWILRDGRLRPLSSHGARRMAPGAINDAGQITGRLDYPSSPLDWSRAFFLQDESATPVFLPFPTNSSYGADIDAGGRIYGSYLEEVSPRAFAWSPGGSFTRLGSSRSSATAASERGGIVGVGCHSCGRDAPALFRNGAMIPLDDLSPAGDWTFSSVAGINDRGWIVGTGTHRATGATGALLLTPPAP